MTGRNGFFKRIGNPILITIGRSQQLVKKGDVILADFDSMMAKEGWKFEPRFDPKKNKMELTNREVRHSTDVERHLTRQEVVNSSLIDITNMKRAEMVRPPVETKHEQVINEKFNQLVETNVVKLEDVEENIIEHGEIKLDKLKDLKSLSNKDWISYTKDQCVNILKDAGVDYSHVSNEKWEYVKLIKSIIKEIK